MSEKEDVIVCRCEEITEREVIDAIKNGARSVNEVKRWTRAGMGLCQGRTCRRLIERLISQYGDVELSKVPQSSARQPVRPFKIGNIE